MLYPQTNKSRTVIDLNGLRFRHPIMTRRKTRHIEDLQDYLYIKEVLQFLLFVKRSAWYYVLMQQQMQRLCMWEQSR